MVHSEKKPHPAPGARHYTSVHGAKDLFRGIRRQFGNAKALQGELNPGAHTRSCLGAAA